MDNRAWADGQPPYAAAMVSQSPVSRSCLAAVCARARDLLTWADADTGDAATQIALIDALLAIEDVAATLTLLAADDDHNR